MSRLHSVVLMLALTPCALPAQAEEALNASRIAGFITLGRLAGNSLQWTIGDEETTSQYRDVTPGHLFALRGGDEVRIMLKFYNPLRFTWSMEAKELAEPLVVGAEKFLASASALFALVSGDATMGDEDVRSFAMRSRPTPRPPTSGAPPDTLPTYFDESLQEWALWLATNPACMSEPDGLRKRLLDRASKVDRLLYGINESGSSHIQAAGDFRSHFRRAVETLGKSDSREALKRDQAIVDEELTQLEASTIASANALNGLRDAFNEIVESQGGSVCANLLRHSNNVLSSFAARSDVIVSARRALTGEFRKLHQSIGTIIGEPLARDRGFLIGKVKLSPGKRSDVTVTLIEREVTFKDDRLTVKEKSKSAASFQIMQHQSVIIDFVQGVAYSNLAYPRFKTNDASGSSVVADAGSDRPRMMALAMWNLIPNTGWSGFTRLVGQIGIGATTESPVLAFGAGIRLSSPSPFFLTAGVAFPFVNQLKSLKIGDPVDGAAALEQDLERRLGSRPALYIGLQK